MKRRGLPADRARAGQLQQVRVKSVEPQRAGPQVRDRRWPGTLMAIGVFVALLSVLTVVPWTLIEPAMMLRFFIGLCFVGNLLPYANSGLRMGMERFEWFFFNLLAIGPMLTALLLWVNFLFHGPATSASHVVVRVEDHGTYLTYIFRDGYLDSFWMARSTYRDWPDSHGHILEVSTAKGLLGIDVLLGKRPVQHLTR